MHHGGQPLDATEQSHALGAHGCALTPQLDVIRGAGATPELLTGLHPLPHQIVMRQDLVRNETNLPNKMAFPATCLNSDMVKNENKRKWKSSGKEITLTHGRKRTTSSAIMASSICFHPDICVQTKFVPAVPLLSVVVSGGGVSEA